MKECQESQWAGHPGMHRTFALVSHSDFWPQLKDDVETYVRTSLVCQEDKVEQARPAGLLHPLPIPAWESIFYGFFIVGLATSEG